MFLGRSTAGRTASLFVLAADAADQPQRRTRFATDVAAARRVIGPRTVPVIDADPAADRPWLAYARPSGPALADLLDADGPVPVDRLLPLTHALAEGLAGLHTSGVTHRDLTPANILVTADGIRLTGFGIAAPADLVPGAAPGTGAGTQPRARTRTRVQKVPPPALAPEQVTGQPATTASDVFALGALLYLVATAEPPFGTGPAQTVRDRLMQADCDVRRIGHPLLAELVASCLEVDPARRPSAAQLAGRTAAALGVAVTTAGREGEPRVPAALPPALPVVPPPSLPLPLFRSPDTDRAPAEVDAESGHPLPAISPPPAPSDPPPPMSAPSPPAPENLPSAGPTPPVPSQPVQQHPVQQHPVQQHPDVPHLPTGAAVPPRTRRRAPVLVYAAAALAAVLVVALGSMAWFRFGPRSAPAAARTTSSAGGSLSAADAAGGAGGGTAVSAPRTVTAPRAQLVGHTRDVLAVGYDARGTRLVTAGADRVIRIWDAATGEPRSTITTPAGSVVTAIAFSPDGKLLATTGDDGSSRLRDPVTGRISRTLRGHPGGATAVAFSPDGKLLATAGKDGKAHLWNPTTGKRVRVLSGHTGGTSGLAFSADGDLLATVGADGGARLWRTRTGEPVRNVAPSAPSPLACVAFSPDGSQLAFGSEDGRTVLWKVADGSRRELAGATGAEHTVAFSPDGTRLASAGEAGTTTVWDVDGGDRAVVFGAPGTPVTATAFSPDGHTLATVGARGTARLWTVPAR